MIYELLSYNGDIELGVTFDMKRYAVILAAGQGTRMKSKLYKVLHPILGRPMIQYVVEALTPSKIEELVTIVGHGAEEVSKEIGSKSEYVIRDDSGNVSQIVEHKDASQEELSVKEINTGTYCFDNKALFEALEKVDNNNAQGEYYLPDVVEILKKDEEKISAYLMPDQEESI